MIMLCVISSAISALGIPALTGFMNLVLSWLPNLIAALDQQSTARLDRDYTDTGTITPGNGSAGMNPARGAGAHRDR